VEKPLKKVILEKICNRLEEELPQEFQNLDIQEYGIDISLFDYQSKAIVNLLHCLNIYYQRKKSNKELLLDKYRINGLDDDLQDKLDINYEDENFNFLSGYYEVTENKIEFKEIINRASFWMATGSGKTLVMVKLIDILFKLI